MHYSDVILQRAKVDAQEEYMEHILDFNKIRNFLKIAMEFSLLIHKVYLVL
jgi:hypothetical protein